MSFFSEILEGETGEFGVCFVMVSIPLGFPALDFRAEPPLRAGGVWIVCVGFWLPVHLPCSVPSCAVISIPWMCFRQFGEQGEWQPLCTAGVCRATDTSVKQLWCRAMGQPRGMQHFRTPLQTWPLNTQEGKRLWAAWAMLFTALLCQWDLLAA